MIPDVGDSFRSSLAETVGQVFGRAQEQRALPADLYESDEAFLAIFDAPGAESPDVHVTYDGNAIEVRIDRFRDFYDGFEMEFPGRGLTLDGRVELPEGASVDPMEATAMLRDDGTLHIRVPKIEQDDAETDEETTDHGGETTDDQSDGQSDTNGDE